MVALTFPDGARREYPHRHHRPRHRQGHLALAGQAHRRDGARRHARRSCRPDRAATPRSNSSTRDDPRALELIRHDAAHVLAEAVQSLWPGTQVTIGPVIENGFYYDFFRNAAVHAGRPRRRSRRRCARSSRATNPSPRKCGRATRPSACSATRARHFKVELVDAIPRRPADQDLQAGRLVRSLPRPAHDLDRQGRQRLQTDEGRGRLLARRLQQPDADPHLRHRLRQAGRARRLSQTDRGGREARPPQARPRDGPVPLPGGRPRHGVLACPRAGPSSRRSSPICAAARRATITRSTRRSCSTSRCGRRPATGGRFRETCSWRSRPARTEDERVFAIKPMNCPGHIQIFKHGLRSYRELPLRMAEFGVVHRYEPSGALHGLMRVRAFTQDDAHVFCTEEQMADECLKINDLILSTYADFGFEGDLTVKLSTGRKSGSAPMRRGTTPKASCRMCSSASRREPQPTHQDRDQSGRRRVLRAEVRIRAARRHRPRLAVRHHPGRLQPAGAVRAPSTSPPTARRSTPVMIHRAICGSMERFLGILLEHYAGHLPLWLAPVQAVVATITSDADDYAREVLAAALRLGLRVESRPAQREDQLQGARALARQGAGAAGGRPQGGGRADGLDPPPRQRAAAGDAARCRAEGAGRRSDAARRAKDQASGVSP